MPTIPLCSARIQERCCIHIWSLSKPVLSKFPFQCRSGMFVDVGPRVHVIRESRTDPCAMLLWRCNSGREIMTERHIS